MNFQFICCNLHWYTALRTFIFHRLCMYQSLTDRHAHIGENRRYVSLQTVAILTSKTCQTSHIKYSLCLPSLGAPVRPVQRLFHRSCIIHTMSGLRYSVQGANPKFHRSIEFSYNYSLAYHGLSHEKKLCLHGRSVTVTLRVDCPHVENVSAWNIKTVVICDFRSNYRK